MTGSYIPYGAYWSSPFARWQGSLGHLPSVEFAAHLTRESLATELGVFADFQPKLAPLQAQAELVFLGNIHPALQTDVLEQVALQQGQHNLGFRVAETAIEFKNLGP